MLRVLTTRTAMITMLTIPQYAYYILLGGHGHLQAAAAGAQGAAADGRAAPHAAGPPIARAVGGWRRGGRSAAGTLV